MTHGRSAVGGLTRARSHGLTWAGVIWLGAAWLAVAGPGNAQAVGPAAAEIDPILAEDLEMHLEVLASDLLEGRETGTPGEDRAQRYLIAMLSEHPWLEPMGDDGGWTQSFPLTGAREAGQEASGENVLALLRGRDPVLAEQVIVVGAHYDHVGYGRSGDALDAVNDVHNGADDNGSGTSALLELAAELASRPQRPRRSVLFAFFSGEEKGLVGSRWVVEHPPIPIEQTVVMLNMDMVGRLRANRLLVGGVGTAEGMESLVLATAEGQGLDILTQQEGGAPSDNSSYYAAGVPALFLFTGLHANYHRVSDDLEFVNLDGLARVARYCRDLVDALDALDEPLPFREAPGRADMWYPRIFFGVAVDEPNPNIVVPEEARGGARLAVVLPGSPAEAAGLREGDLVVSVDGEPVDGASGLRSHFRTDELTPLTLRIWRGVGDGEVGGLGGGGGASTGGWSTVELQPVFK